MDAHVLARVLHVLAVVHWIGGVAMVALVILPQLRALPAADALLACRRQSVQMDVTLWQGQHRVHRGSHGQRLYEPW